MGNTSLDDFTGEDEEADDESDADTRPTQGADATDAEQSVEGDESPSEDAATDRPEASADVEPAVSTHEWTPGGADCEDCGATVERRWRDDDALVCGDCKDW